MSSAITVETSRIEALSDGVFAIAMTLLVLKLEVPPVMYHSSNASMLEQMLALTPAFLTYVITFLVAGGFWYLHHLTFHFIRCVDSVLLWIDLVFLMFVSLLPFSAGLMSHLLMHPISQVFYFGNQLAIALLLNIHWFYAERVLLPGHARSHQKARLTCRIVSTAAAFASALVTGLFLPLYSIVPLALVLAGSFVWEQIHFARRREPTTVLPSP